MSVDARTARLFKKKKEAANKNYEVFYLFIFFVDEMGTAALPRYREGSVW